MAQNTNESIGANTFEHTDDYYERRDAFVKKMKRRAKSKKIFVFGILILLLLLLLSGGTYYVVHSVQKPHTHTFSEVWTTDDNAHWHKCSGCQDIKDKANHTYDDNCDADCNVCGALRTAPHSYDAAYRDDATNHWQECTVCHSPTAAVAHSYSSDCDAICNVCDATRTVSAEHTFGTEWIGIVDGHYHLCTKCGAESSHLEHSFKSGICDDCDYAREELAFSYYSGTGSYAVTGIGRFKGTDIVIPATYDDGTSNGLKPVTSVDWGAFIENTTITSVTFSENMKTIGLGAFAGCSSLSSVTLSGTITKIETGAFGACPLLTSITLPSGLKEIEMLAFSQTGLTSVNIPASVETIGANPFALCADLTTITVDSANTKFKMLDNNLIDIASKNIITGLNLSTIPTDSTQVTTIGDYAFAARAGLQRLVVPNNITSIGQEAFGKCEGLVSVELSSGMSFVDNSMFLGCSNLESVVIPAHITALYEDVFDDCENLTTIYYGGTSTQWGAMRSDKSNTAKMESITVYCYSDAQPQILNETFWHYAGGLPTLWDVHTAHVYDNACDTACNICGLTRTTTHQYGTTYQSDETNHWKVCTICSAPSTGVAHSCVDGKCSVCGFVEITQGLEYEFVAGETPAESYYKVVSIGTSLAKHIRIPATYDDGTNDSYPVKSVGSYAFVVRESSDEGIYSITFSENMEVIEDFAFGACSNLTSVQFSDTITKIGDGVFMTCSALTNITLPDSLTELGNMVFSFGGLTSINIPKNVSVIAEIQPFMFCESLTTITADRENAIFRATNNCLINTATKEIVAGADMANIPTDSTEVTAIGYGAFAGQIGVTNLKIPDNITKIKESAFDNCTSIVSVELPAGLTLIEAYAFRVCSGLTTVYYGGTTPEQWDSVVESTGNDYLISAIRYYFSATQPQVLNGNFWHYVGGVPTAWPVHTAHVYDNDCDTDCNTCSAVRTAPHTYGEYCYDDTNHWQICTTCETVSEHTAHTNAQGKCSACDYILTATGLTYTYVSSATDATVTTPYYEVSGIGSVSSAKYIRIPEVYNDGTNGEHPVASIGNNVFLNATNLEKIIIPNSVTKIKEASFANCGNLSDVTLSTALTEIGKNAFRGCGSLASISIPNSVTTIGEGAFAAAGLTSITLPSNLVTVDICLLEDCTSLTTIMMSNSVTTVSGNAFKDCTSLTNITLSSNLSTIGQNAFDNCTSLTSILMPNSVTSIGTNAFANCSSLSSVTISTGLTSLRNGIFMNCTSLTSIIIPDGTLATIEGNAFKGCTNLASIVIPTRVTSINTGAFTDCANLTSIFYRGDSDDWAEMTVTATFPASAVLYYHSATEPTEAMTGNFWSYVGGVPTAWTN